MKDDLRFREAKPIAGGREMWSKQGLEDGAHAVERRTTSRRATRSATGGPARSSARTRSAACGAVRPTAATSQAIAASKTRVRAARQARSSRA